MFGELTYLCIVGYVTYAHCRSAMSDVVVLFNVYVQNCGSLIPIKVQTWCSNHDTVIYLDRRHHVATENCCVIFAYLKSC